MSSLKNNFNLINQTLNKYNSDAKIIAVCKKQPISKVKEVVDLGVTDLGINYINEFDDLKNELPSSEINWHYIGSIQSNKLNKIVGKFNIIQSVSKLKAIEKINQIAESLGIVQKVLFQLNLSNEASKSGFTKPDYLEVIKKIDIYKNVYLCGLMTMPPLGNGKKYFEELLNIKKESKDNGQSSSNYDIKYLSMGTSGDYEEAIQCGATHIRLGTVLMGPRS